MKNLIEYEIYIPGKDRRRKAVVDWRRRIVEYYGGLTDTRHKNLGLWKFGGVTIKDEVVLWRVLSDRGPAGDRFMTSFRKSLEVQLDEDLILIVRRTVKRL